MQYPRKSPVILRSTELPHFRQARFTHIDGYGWSSGYGYSDGYGDRDGGSAYIDGNGTAKGAGYCGFNEAGFAHCGDDPPRTERIFRCAGCIGGFECSIHGRRL